MQGSVWSVLYLMQGSVWSVLYLIQGSVWSVLYLLTSYIMVVKAKWLRHIREVKSSNLGFEIGCSQFYFSLLANSRIKPQHITQPLPSTSHPIHKSRADSIGRVVWGVGLRPLACWECGFESRQRHVCLSVVSVVCCQVEISASSWSLVSRRVLLSLVCLTVIVKPR